MSQRAAAGDAATVTATAAALTPETMPTGTVAGTIGASPIVIVHGNEQVPCPYCQRLFAPTGINVHIGLSHPASPAIVAARVSPGQPLPAVLAKAAAAAAAAAAPAASAAAAPPAAAAADSGAGSARPAVRSSQMRQTQSSNGAVEDKVVAMLRCGLGLTLARSVVGGCVGR